MQRKSQSSGVLFTELIRILYPCKAEEKSLNRATVLEIACALISLFLNHHTDAN